MLYSKTYFLGALLARFGRANVAMPGGCNFGVRPINLHLKGFNSLGAEHKIDGGMIRVVGKELKGTQIYFDVVSVGATINILLAATRAKGMTIIENAAREPHIVDLANFLNSIGANIMGAGTNVIKINNQGGDQLRKTQIAIVVFHMDVHTRTHRQLPCTYPYKHVHRLHVCT